MAAFASNDFLANPVAQERHGKERDQGAVQAAFEESEDRADVSVELSQAESVDRRTDHPKCDPDDKRRADEKDQHGEKPIPRRFGMNRLAKGFSEVIRDQIADHNRGDRGELPCEALDGSEQGRADEHDQHYDVVDLHRKCIRASKVRAGNGR